MANKTPIRHLAENEAVFRRHNEQIQHDIDKLNAMARESGQDEYAIRQRIDDLPLYFYCECSDENCRKRVRLNHLTYNRIHLKRDRFIVAPGHQAEKVERVLRREPGYYVVKKYAPPPEDVGGLRPTDTRNV